MFRIFTFASLSMCIQYADYCNKKSEFMIYSIGAQFDLIRSVAKAVSTSSKRSIAAICMAFAVVWFSPSAYAEAGKTILVLDASGSMWGKISGGYKIKIARDVVDDMLDTLPADHEIGLVTYGHRQEASCDDIELLVPPAVGTRDAISEAMGSLDPKGRTPLSAAVIAAADEIGLDEDSATVVLISDGEETCFMDPCAVSFELEKRGIDFVAHVVGFDIKEGADQAQLQCLAENTGGLFFSASSAAELSEALSEISNAMTEPAKATTVRLSATVQDHDNTPVSTGIAWSITPISTDSDNPPANLLSGDKSTSAELRETLDLGWYTLSVTRDSDGATTSRDLDLTNNEITELVLTLPPPASIKGPGSVGIGEIFDVTWEGPGGDDDLIAVADSVNPSAKVISVFSADNSRTTTLRAPTTPGEYQLRYVYAAERSVIATSLLKVVDVPTTLDAPDGASAGYLVAVNWEGPNVTHDAIVVAEIGASGSISETGTHLGNPAMVQMPTKPGTYEIRYLLFQDSKILASRPITVVEGAIKIDAPDETGVGYLVNVDWVGPDAEKDAIVVAEVGAVENISKTDTILGNPAIVQMPAKPGEYELRYVLHNESTIMASRRINVVDVELTLDAVDQGRAGDDVLVNWTGPDAHHDTIAIAEVGALDYISATSTYLGNPATLQMPTEPGYYELRYVLHDGQTTMATRPIQVIDADVNQNAPAE